MHINKSLNMGACFSSCWRAIVANLQAPSNITYTLYMCSYQVRAKLLLEVLGCAQKCSDALGWRLCGAHSQNCGVKCARPRDFASAIAAEQRLRARRGVHSADATRWACACQSHQSAEQRRHATYAHPREAARTSTPPHIMAAWRIPIAPRHAMRWMRDCKPRADRWQQRSRRIRTDEHMRTVLP